MPKRRFVKPSGVTFAAWLERRKLSVIIGLLLGYFVFTCCRAALTLLEFDEILTARLSHLPTIHQIWLALMAGSDGNPPLYYLVTRIFSTLLGDSSLATRMPSIISFAIMGICIFAFVRKRASTIYAFVAMILPFTTSAYELASLARPYAFVLGCSGVSLICWQSVYDGRLRRTCLCGLTLSLIAAAYSHFYALCLLAPIAAAELVRSLSRKRLDGAVWVSLGVAALLMIPLFPLARAGYKYSAHFWAKPEIYSVAESYRIVMEPLIFPFFMALVIMTIIGGRRWRSTTEEKPFARECRPGEIVLAILLALFPFLVAAVAFTLTNAFVPQYGIVSVIGVSIIFALAIERGDDQYLIGTVLLICLAGWFGTKQVYNVSRLLSGSQVEPLALSDSKLPLDWYSGFKIPAVSGFEAVPIVVSDAHLFNQLSFYLLAERKSRLVFLTDEKAAVLYQGYDTDDRLLGALKHWTSLEVEDYKKFVREHTRFLVYGQGWVVARSVGEGAEVRVAAEYAGEFLYAVTTTLGRGRPSGGMANRGKLGRHDCSFSGDGGRMRWTCPGMKDTRRYSSGSWKSRRMSCSVRLNQVCASRKWTS